MSEEGFVKLYGRKLLRSTVWDQPTHVRCAWVGMLAEADISGHVRAASVSGLARILNLTVEETESALAVLEAPDPNSTTPDEDGRRVVRVAGGWRLVNYVNHREYRSQKQEDERLRKAAERAKHRSLGSGHVQEKSRKSGTRSLDLRRQKTEAEIRETPDAHAREGSGEPEVELVAVAADLQPDNTPDRRESDQGPPSGVHERRASAAARPERGAPTDASEQLPPPARPEALAGAERPPWESPHAEKCGYCLGSPAEYSCTCSKRPTQFSPSPSAKFEVMQHLTKAHSDAGVGAMPQLFGSLQDAACRHILGLAKTYGRPLPEVVRAVCTAAEPQNQKGWVHNLARVDPFAPTRPQLAKTGRRERAQARTPEDFEREYERVNGGSDGRG